MKEWYQRQFGDRSTFALSLALGVDPHPCGDPERDLSWGSLEMWARGRCLTRSASEGGLSQAVHWTLLPVLTWLTEVALRLVNEDPYPRLSKGTDVPDGVSWYDATLATPLLTEDARKRWFLRRSEWRHHHALRRAAEDCALPNVVFKRQAHDVEISWDNTDWAAPRADLEFLEKRGRELVPASSFADALREALVSVSGALAERHPLPRFTALAQEVAGLRAGAEDWRWLVHRPTAARVRSTLPELCATLDDATRVGARGLLVPHTVETLALRHARLEDPTEIEALVAAARTPPGATLAATLRDWVRPRPASSNRPWDEGNDYAEQVRDALGWGTQPLPDLATWLPNQGVSLPSGDLKVPASITLITRRTDDARAMAFVNPAGRSYAFREVALATALGHLLLDDVALAVEGEWEHWPTAARARAFGVALALPEDGVREQLRGVEHVEVKQVRALMRHFRTGPQATTHRLKHLGLISADEQVGLAAAATLRPATSRS